MNSSFSYPRGMFFEEFQPGQRIVTIARTITEADIVNFASASGDFTQIHVDVEYCKNTPFGQRVAHGLLVLSIAIGMTAQSGIMENTVLAFREINEWKFSKPVFIGDTIHAELEVLETKNLKRIGGGSVKINMEVKNQDGDIVMKGILTVLMRLKAG